MSPSVTNFKSTEAPPAARTTAPDPEPAAAERPVFAASGSARPRLLRVAGRLAAGLTLLWLAALALGVGGFGGLPNIDLPVVGEGGGASHDATSPARPQEPLAAASTVARRSAAMRGAQARRAASARRLAQRRAENGRRSRGSTAPGTPSTASAQPSSTTTASPHYSGTAVRRGSSSASPGSRRSGATEKATGSTSSSQGAGVGRATDPPLRKQSAR